MWLPRSLFLKILSMCAFGLTWWYPWFLCLRLCFRLLNHWISFFRWFFWLFIFLYWFWWFCFGLFLLLRFWFLFWGLWLMIFFWRLWLLLFFWSIRFLLFFWSLWFFIFLWLLRLLVFLWLLRFFVFFWLLRLGYNRFRSWSGFLFSFLITTFLFLLFRDHNLPNLGLCLFLLLFLRFLWLLFLSLFLSITCYTSTIRDERAWLWILQIVLWLVFFKRCLWFRNLTLFFLFETLHRCTSTLLYTLYFFAILGWIICGLSVDWGCRLGYLTWCRRLWVCRNFLWIWFCCLLTFLSFLWLSLCCFFLLF